jgi:hypothetical protein
MPMYRVTFQGNFMDPHSGQLHDAGIIYEGRGNSGPPEPAGSITNRALVEASSSSEAIRLFSDALGSNLHQFGNLRAEPA